MLTFDNQQQFIALYESAFPEIERRPTAQELALDDPRFEIRTIRHEGNFAGFITLWHFAEFVYVEHFATLPELRGHGLGSRTLQTLRHESPKPIVLEVELPDNDTAHRRIAFYKRMGFVEMPQAYWQPPYMPENSGLPLRIMTTANDTNDRFFDTIKSTLYREVYKFSEE